MMLRMTAVVLALLSAGGAAGCEAPAGPRPANQAVGYAELTSAPVGIETAPSVVYAGQPAYFYGNRWWYRDGASWSYYRAEPAELYRQRESVQHGARPSPAPPVSSRDEGEPPERPR